MQNFDVALKELFQSVGTNVEMIDLGNLDAEELLSSEKIGDVILAILNRHADPEQTLRRIWID